MIYCKCANRDRCRDVHAEDEGELPVRYKVCFIASDGKVDEKLGRAIWGAPMFEHGDLWAVVCELMDYIDGRPMAVFDTEDGSVMDGMAVLYANPELVARVRVIDARIEARKR